MVARARRRAAGAGGSTWVGALLLLAASPLLAGSAGEGPQGGASRVMFVTSTTGPADLDTWTEALGSGLSGLDAGDKICQVRAEAAGLAAAGSPVFRAWLSTTPTDAYCHVQGLSGKKSSNCGGLAGAAGPWLRTDGHVYANSLSELVGQGPLNPPSRTETGGNGGSVPGLAWSGTNADGTLGADQCSGWNSTVGGGQGLGATTSLAYWTQGYTDGCGSARRLYCFEQGSGQPAPLPVGPAALAFISSETGPGDLDLWASADALPGLAGGDRVCQNLAGAAGLPLPASFKAWLSDGSTGAKDRLALDGPWNRVDGQRIADSKVDLVDGEIFTGLHLDESGVRFGASTYVWSGTGSGGTALADRCADWGSSLGADAGIRGVADDSNFQWTVHSSTACNQSFHLYCFGDQLLLMWDDFERADLLRWSSSIGVP